MNRMWDVSQFMKELKQRFSLWFNKRECRKGTLWEERFTSVLLEGELATLSVMSAYIDLVSRRSIYARSGDKSPPRRVEQ